MKSKYIIVGVNDKLHNQIKIRAIEEGKSIKSWVIETLLEKLLQKKGTLR